jgi:hypothetical protein
MNIHFYFRQRRFYIRRDVIFSVLLLKGLYKAMLRRNVKNIKLRREEIGFLFQVKPYQAMAFQTQAMGTQCILPGVDPSIGKEFFVVMIANRAFYFFSDIKQSSGL